MLCLKPYVFLGSTESPVETKSIKIIDSMPVSLFDFVYGPADRQNPDMAVRMYGRSLLDMLKQEGYLDLNSNVDANSLIKKLTNKHGSFYMNLLGKLAEYAIVDECNKSFEVNRTLLEKANFPKRIDERVAHNFLAIARGSKITKAKYPHYSDSNDPQRDILWISRSQPSDVCVINTNDNQGRLAGLQIKVSQNVFNDVYQNILSNRYQSPILYFPLNRDYDDALCQLLKFSVNNRTAITPQQNFVMSHLYNLFLNAESLVPEIYMKVRCFYTILYNIYENKYTFEQLVRNSMNNFTIIDPKTDKFIQNALLSEAVNDEIESDFPEATTIQIETEVGC